ncbi:PE-PPE domain-containing protein [Mycobacterium sp. JS623]|nr:PE-PPE domain-containing protein [Mycobacterium sp. JS623]
MLLVAMAAVGSALLLGVNQTMTAVVALSATYIVKGTNSAFNQIPDSAYPAFAQKYDNAVGAPTPDPIILVPYPATFWPVTPPGFIFSPTYDQSVATGVRNLEGTPTSPGLRPLNSTSTDTLWGYSQGATVVTQYKRDWNAAFPSNPGAVHPIYVLVANPNRPNGGILERGVAFGTIPILGLTFSGATPTQTAGVPNCNCANDPNATITTYDIARQYDGISDAPVNPLNPVADLNAAMGFYYLHGQYPNADPTTAIDQGTYGDTHYYLIPTYPLPLLMPLESIPVIGFPLADTLDPPLRVIVESAYDRNTSPGVPTPANPLYFPNPATFATDLLIAVPTGLDNGIGDFTGSRPFGTTRPGPYGVGGSATIGLDGKPMPPPSSPTAGTSPTIPVLFGSPGGGFLGLLPASMLASPTASTGAGIGSALDPMNALSSPASAAGQPPAGAAAVDRATAWTNRTPATTDPTSSATPQNSASPLPGISVTNVGTQPPNDPQPSTSNPGPRLNVLRSSLGAPSPQPRTSSSTGSQATNNPIGTALSSVTNSVAGVAKSISSTLGGLSKAAEEGSK